MKLCCHCEIEKTESEFTKDAAREDGISAWCRACRKQQRIDAGLSKPEGWRRKTENMREYQRLYEKNNPEKFRKTPEQERAKYVRKMKRLHGECWVPKQLLTAEQRAASKKRHNRQGHEIRNRRRKVDPVLDHKIKARKYLHNAVKRGTIQRLPCSICGAEPAHGHHEDYSKPLEVVWLCEVHHRERHVTPHGCE